MNSDKPNNAWAEETVARLRELWDEGHSTTQIGRRLGVSKNAIVGKAHRLELAARPSPIKRGAPGGPQPARQPRAVPKLADQMPDLVLRPSAVLAHKPWALQLRYHNGGAETEYVTIARLTEQRARDVAGAGAATWLHGEPTTTTPAAADDRSDDTNAAAWFVNSYRCPECNHEWSDRWTATCEDDCPACGKRHITPHKSEDA